MVEYNTTIIGINDSEKLDLVRVNFDAIDLGKLCESGAQYRVR